MDKLKRYYVPCGHGAEEHPAGLLYWRKEVDDRIAAMAEENERLRAELIACRGAFTLSEKEEQGHD